MAIFGAVRFMNTKGGPMTDRMTRRGAAARLAAAALAGFALSGCSDDEPPAAQAQAEQIAPKVPVQRIESLELGRLYKGYMLTAYALAPGAGYYEPELRQRYGGQPSADGFYEFDFMVRPPDIPGDYGAEPASARQIRGDFELSVDDLRGAAGVRVWSANGALEGRF